MTDTVTESVTVDDQAEALLEASAVEQKLLDQLVEQARNQGLQLTGEGRLLQQLTKTVLESALEDEITDRLGYDKHDPAGKDGGNSRNGTRSKTVLTVSPVEIDVPRDVGFPSSRPSSTSRQRRLTGVDEMGLSLSAKGLTHGEISAHLAEFYGATVAKMTITTTTDKVMDGMAEGQNRPLDRVSPVVFIDASALTVKVRRVQA
ncbi:transposase [Streptomyces sp. NPDC002870]|uniref:transposase n=1 Tax=Streptomyces sp. NPDC002870 TaxID=3364666 RepID=UPI00367B66D0